jgi:hypothetical protein
MKESLILQHLEETAEKLNIKVCNVNLHRDAYHLKSGLCKIKGEYRIIVDKNIHLSEKIDAFIDALQEFDIDSVYIHPYVRKLLEKKARATDGHNQ